MKNIKFLTVLIATTLFVACGESSFSGTSAPQKKAAARTDAKAESPKNEGTDAQQDTQKAKDSDAKADTADKGKELGGKIDLDDATNSPGNGPSSPDSNSTSPTSSGPEAGDGDTGKWREDQVITDLITLEECKMDILKRTGDASICMKCFQAFVANGNITAGACGCAWAKNPPAASPAPAPKP
jgi:hypothetical protein